MNRERARQSLAGYETAQQFDQMLAEQMARLPIAENAHYWLALAQSLRNTADLIEAQASRALDES
jgi:hypothetical protein